MFWAPLLLTVGAAASVPKRLSPAEIAPYPPMQWHSWGLFTHEDLVTQANMEEMADALVESGMAAAGYATVNVVCNGWTGRDPVTGTLLENATLWPTGMAGLATKLHAMEPPLKLGCYTAPLAQNCACGPLPGPGGGCEQGSLGHETVDMEFFATLGCDHVMVDNPRYVSDADFRQRYAVIGAAIANSSNPNMLYGVWGGGSAHTWKWAAGVGGSYWRMGGDIYDSWQSVMRLWDATYSVPSIESFTAPGRYSFLDQMIVGDVPHRAGAAYGPGLSTDEAEAHFSMWVMAASPLLTCIDVRNMSAAVKALLTDPEVLAVHKDPLARMAARIDVGGGAHELHSASLCPAQFPACQEGPGDPGYPGAPCATCRDLWSVWEKPLADGSSAVMLLNRGDAAANVPLATNDLGDSMQAAWSARDLWVKRDLGVITTSTTLTVPAHGVRLLRMRPAAPAPAPTPPPPPPTVCPAGFSAHADGLWSNPLPCGAYPTPSGCTTRDAANGTMALCGAKCEAAAGCLAFELSQDAPKECWIFVGELKPPFTPSVDCRTCVKD